MNKYYVINASLSFGFGGFIKKACTTKEEADYIVSQLKKRYRNLTECEVSIVSAKNKKDAEGGCPSMFSGEFYGIDKVKGV